jgi:hypothetical protein
MLVVGGCDRMCWASFGDIRWWREGGGGGAGATSPSAGVGVRMLACKGGHGGAVGRAGA